MLIVEYTEEVRPSDESAPRVANGFCGEVVIVERLLDNEGTSSQDIRTAGPGSPNMNDRESVPAEVALPRRGVPRETWLLLKTRLEKEEPLSVSGVMIDCCGSGSEKLRC